MFVVVVTVGVPVAAAATHALRDRQHDVRDRLTEVEDLAHDARHEEANVSRDVRELQTALRSRNDALATVSDQLEALDRELAQARQRLREAEHTAALRREQLATAVEQRAVAERSLETYVLALYKGEDPGGLTVLLGAESAGDLLDRIEFSSRVVEESARLVAQLTATRSELDEQRRRATKLEEAREGQARRVTEHRNERRATLAAVEHEREHLLALRDQRRASLAALVVSRRKWEVEADALRADSLRIEKLLQARAATTRDEAESVPRSGPEAAGAPPAVQDQAQPTSELVPASARLSWPLQGALTSPFGTRWGKLHTGIDIAAPAGTAISAAAGGTVVLSGWFGGYGLLVVVDHGNGLATAYAHNSAVSVSEGDSVSRGQTVASVGCTGSCTGDHVHFEVRVGGVAVDPMPFL